MRCQHSQLGNQPLCPSACIHAPCILHAYPLKPHPFAVLQATNVELSAAKASADAEVEVLR